MIGTESINDLNWLSKDVSPNSGIAGFPDVVKDFAWSMKPFVSLYTGFNILIDSEIAAASIYIPLIVVQVYRPRAMTFAQLRQTTSQDRVE